MMENNKLIAEFMGRGGTFNHDKTMICTGIYPDTMTLMKYHTSWDWLMPVVQKIEKLEVGDVKWTSVYFNIEREYDKAVKFIKKYNDEQQ